MVVTLSGIVILVSPLQFLNAESPMLQKRPFPSFPSCIVLFTDSTPLIKSISFHVKANNFPIRNPVYKHRTIPNIFCLLSAKTAHSIFFCSATVKQLTSFSLVFGRFILSAIYFSDSPIVQASFREF